MYNRAEVVDNNFTSFLRQAKFPEPLSATSYQDAGLTLEDLVDLFESQVTSRHLDLRARILKNEGRSYYTIGSSGHEGNAAAGHVFFLKDMAFLHYRSCALMVQRAKQLPGSTPIYDHMLAFTASADDPIAGGRHKVFGSRPLNVPPQTSTIASHLPKTVGAALSLHKAKDLKLKEATLLPDSVILCSFGDATINHAAALSALNSASWAAYHNLPVPLVFLCEDNQIGISVPTPDNWVKDALSRHPEIEYLACDGLNVCDVYLKSKQARHIATTRKKPVFLHMKTVRLLGHAGSDVETDYTPLKVIEKKEFNDPLLHTARQLIKAGFDAEKLITLYEELRQRVRAVAEWASSRPKLKDPAEVASTITTCTNPRQAPTAITQQALKEKLGPKEAAKLASSSHLAKLINLGLHEILVHYKNAVVFGEDVAQKGGVYNVTDGLLKRFGAKRVFNSPLDETSILGTAVGLAHNGFLPIPEIQFLAYVHNAQDQIRGEAATLPFFSQGQFTNPMIVRIAGLAYQKGFGGHFHNDNSLAIFRDIPGLIIACPSNGADAVQMLRACAKEAYERGRVVIFVEPIALYMTRDLYAAGDKKWTFYYPDMHQLVAPGEFHVEGEGQDVALISYANGYHYCLQAAKELKEQDDVRTRIIDLRWLKPLNTRALADAVKPCKKILIVDECRKTGSFSEQLMTELVESLQTPDIKRITADDCFIPLGEAAAAGLPHKEDIVKTIRQWTQGSVS